MAKKETLKQTPSQTVGPYFAFGMTPEQYGYNYGSIVGNDVEGIDSETMVTLEGRLFDGKGDVIPDAVIEIWQADSQGRYNHPNDRRGSNRAFKGFARHGTGTDPENRFVFHTVKPGSVDGEQAPHMTLIVFMRGLPDHAYTRVYFPDEAAANAQDPVLQSVPQDRRHTLVAQKTEREGRVVYRFDIHMQGDDETVFFDV
jgi:protocatechuate 3,4-dioxygenase alpha subunit